MDKSKHKSVQNRMSGNASFSRQRMSTMIFGFSDCDNELNFGKQSGQDKVLV